MPHPGADDASESVNMDRLTATMGKYSLVVGVAKRARELRDRMRVGADAAPATAITQALEEIANHTVRLRGPDEYDDDEAETPEEETEPEAEQD